MRGGYALKMRCARLCRGVGQLATWGPNTYQIDANHKLGHVRMPHTRAECIFRPTIHLGPN